MKKSLLVVIAAMVTLTAFAMHRQKEKNKATEIVSLSMRRTACFGHCPDYIVTLNKGGNVSYTGIMFVQDSGVYEKNLGTMQVQQMLDRFEAYRIDTCQANYPTRITDIPGIVYTIQYADNHTQRIMNANFGPYFLKDMAKQIDDFVKVDNTWKGPSYSPVYNK